MDVAVPNSSNTDIASGTTRRIMLSAIIKDRGAV